MSCKMSRGILTDQFTAVKQQTISYQYYRITIVHAILLYWARQNSRATSVCITIAHRCLQWNILIKHFQTHLPPQTPLHPIRNLPSQLQLLHQSVAEAGLSSGGAFILFFPHSSSTNLQEGFKRGFMEFPAVEEARAPPYPPLDPPLHLPISILCTHIKNVMNILEKSISSYERRRRLDTSLHYRNMI